MDNELLQAIAQIVKAEIQPINDRLNSMDNRLNNIEQEVVKTSITIENEIHPNIKLLAEGHMGTIERLDRIETKTDEIDDIKDSVSILKNFTFNKSP